MSDDHDDPGRRSVEPAGGDRGVDDQRRSADRGGRLRGLPGGGAGEGLAPVIPLFGGRRNASSGPGMSDRKEASDASSARRGGVRSADEPAGATSHPAGAARSGAPVRVEPSEASDGDAWAGAGSGRDAASGRRPRLRAILADDPSSPGIDGDAPENDADEVRERAEELLLRKLRSRSLSLSEARTVIRGVDGADDVIVDCLIDRFVDLGYLDDATFAEQLVLSAIEKRGEGRRAVAETLRKRGIPRDIAEAALSELPDDDAERALEFARSKMRGVDGKDYDAALRRLGGQLARRGYPSSVALTAARTALSEAGIGRARSFGRPAPAPGVRFTPDD
ncbi:regulatory protein RecX [uncultured Microbacterium sp.]|uniref:regulatory protein RecX n=1 Tax=uncultured Microbacterium sp. TaxID=191216 RepID=UPI0025D77285|nr:regulatory protein RecX [uncultured Microbacterium sp.]